MDAYVIGNVAIDETLAVSAMPKPGASILGTERSRDLGGKGANQAVVMARCGLRTHLVAGVGEDLRGDMVHRRLAAEPVVERLVPITGRSTDFSIILTTPDGENAIVTMTDCAQNLDVLQATAGLKDAQPGDLAVMQGNLTVEVTRRVLEAARSRRMVTAFNPSPLRSFFGELWSLIDVAFLNEGEAIALTDSTGEEAARRLLATGVKAVVLTFGDDGAMLATADSIVRVPAVACPVVDTTGAGDTFMATALASSALRGTTLDRTALEHASKASALTVGRPGTQSAFPTVEELAAILGHLT
jgi:ribokinase